MSDWKSRRTTLLEAHVQHELSRIRPEHIEATVRAEIADAFAWIGPQKLGSLVDEKKITAYIITELREAPAAEGASFLEKAAERIIQTAAKRPETVEQVTGADAHERFVEVLLDSKNLREDLGRDFARSLFFRRLMSEVLFFSLRSFLSEDNIIAKSVPGVSSLFKFGQNLVSKTLPGLDENVSKAVRDFIGRNMDNVVKYTESVLAVQMDDKLVKELADDFWKDFSKRPVSDIAADFGQVPGPKVKEAALAVWDTFRKTDFFAKAAEDVVALWFSTYGEKDTASVLASLGWDEKRVMTAGLDALLPLAEKALESGYWEKATRRRLESFYMSDAAQAAFSKD